MTGKNGKSNNDGSKSQPNETDPPGTPETPRQNQPNNIFDWQTNRPDEPRGFPFAPQNQPFFGFGVPQPNPPVPPVLFNVGRGETERERNQRRGEEAPAFIFGTQRRGVEAPTFTFSFAPPTQTQRRSVEAPSSVFGLASPTQTQPFGAPQGHRYFRMNNLVGAGQNASSSNRVSFGLIPPRDSSGTYSTTEKGQITSADYGFFPPGTSTTETVPPATSSITDMDGSAKSDSTSNKRSASSDTEVNTEAKRLKTSESTENTSRDRPIVIIVPIIFGGNGGGGGEGVSEQASGASSNINLNSAFPVVNVWTDGNITNVRIDTSLIGGMPLDGAPAEDPNQVIKEGSRKEEEEDLEANQMGEVDAAQNMK
ncbi:unnamed protein product [Orchesella dallaii]|uniref:Uncharacterized protein n=1 Tax=Orchesella dallaii TaxID=48710 RepID=A0ABP1R952_9HEXA